MENDVLFMQRCIQISRNGKAAAKPNPSVGAVIVFENRIIAEGFTSTYGGNHAEVNAINQVLNKNILSKCTLYVSLEPCSHFGKTPPCCDLIIKYQIPKIVIGALDPNPVVAGSGIERIKKSGAEVIVGVLEQECINANNHFFTFHAKNRPYIILKWAQSADGFIAPKFKSTTNPFWISNKLSQQLSHKLRSETHGILVGTNTVLDDNPSLTIRTWTGNNPIRLVLDQFYKLSKSLSIFDIQSETIVIGNNEIDFSKNIAVQICNLLHAWKIQSVIIEGGRETLQTFINENIWDEALIFCTNKILNDGVKAPQFNETPTKIKKILDDQLYIYMNK